MPFLKNDVNTMYADSVQHIPQQPKLSMYGGTALSADGSRLDLPLQLSKGVGETFVPFPEYASWHREKVNSLAIAQCILLPWAVFATALWLLSYWVHYLHPHECFFLVGCGLLVVAIVVVRASLEKQKTAKDRETHQRPSFAERPPNWIFFLTFSCTLAWSAGVLLGEYNFVSSMEPYYNIHDLVGVSDVDPRSGSGKQYMDSNVITFSKDSHVDQGKSLSFKDGAVYCVAPITLGSAPLAYYDFWAAGTDCCNPYGGAFWCGDAVLSHSARTGLRIVDDQLMANYRRGVQQASAEYGIEAAHPIFVTWSEDPTTSQGALSSGHPLRLKEKADRFFIWALIMHLFFQTVAVIWVLSHYAKLPDLQDII